MGTRDDLGESRRSIEKPITPGRFLTTSINLTDLGTIDITDFQIVGARAALTEYAVHKDRFRLVADATNEKAAIAQVVRDHVIGKKQSLVEHLLDLGCGDGTLTRLLAPYFDKGVVGVDREATRLAKARENSQNISAEWIETDLIKFDLDGHSIRPTVTLLSHVLYYFRNELETQERLLRREFARLAPAGDLVLIHSGLTGFREDIHNRELPGSFPFEQFLKQQVELYQSIFGSAIVEALSFNTPISASRELATELLRFFADPIPKSEIDEATITKILNPYEDGQGQFTFPYTQVAFVISKPWHTS